MKPHSPRGSGWLGRQAADGHVGRQLQHLQLPARRRHRLQHGSSASSAGSTVTRLLTPSRYSRVTCSINGILLALPAASDAVAHPAPVCVLKGETNSFTASGSKLKVSTCLAHAFF